MERLPYGRYTKEFRQEAVKQVIEEGMSVHEAAKRLSLAPTTLSNWVKAYIRQGSWEKLERTKDR